MVVVARPPLDVEAPIEIEEHRRDESNTSRKDSLEITSQPAARQPAGGAAAHGRIGQSRAMPALTAHWLHEFERINHRMHNKLLKADGALALRGGRNIADECFLGDRVADFIDLDALASDPVLPGGQPRRAGRSLAPPARVPRPRCRSASSSTK